MNVQILLYALGSVALVSAVSLVGALSLLLKPKVLKSGVIYLVSFSAGAFFGDVFFHLLPELSEEIGFTIQVSAWILAGIVFSLFIEKLIRWRHCHMPTSENHPHPVAIMNLVGDAVHNFIDGIIIGASYLVSIPLGIATTTAVIFHEVPQEIGDFGVLLHGGYTKGKAILFNLLTAGTAIIGAVLALALGSSIEGFTAAILPFAAGNFIYIAGSDLIPELHDHVSVKVSILQLAAFVAGIVIMAAMLLLE